MFRDFNSSIWSTKNSRADPRCSYYVYEHREPRKQRIPFSTCVMLQEVPGYIRQYWGKQIEVKDGEVSRNCEVGVG